MGCECDGCGIRWDGADGGGDFGYSSRWNALLYLHFSVTYKRKKWHD